MALLDSKTKFKMTNAVAVKTINQDDFFRWSNSNFYRTSTNDMSAKVLSFFLYISNQVQVSKKSDVIPGYAGYRPQIAADNHHLGKTITEQSREVFKPEVIDKPINNFATTGFNHSLIPKKDAELHATCRRYGKSTMQRTSANFQPLDYHTTTMRSSYQKPTSVPRNTWRERDSTIQFDNSKTLKMKELQSDKLASGYSSNRQHWDGTFWITEKNLHTDQVRTLYRQGFNQ